MRSMLFLLYCLAAIAAIIYFAVPPGGHVAGGVLVSMLGGWGYAVLFAIVAAVIFLIGGARAGVGSFIGFGVAFIAAGLVILFLQPAPLGHMALTAALCGLSGLLVLFGIGVFGRKA